MRKSKRIIALILALTMMFTFMAMSASAATIEIPTVQPRGTCPQCINGYMEDDNVMEEYNYGYSDSCPNIGARHMHYKHVFEYATLCRNCRYRNVYRVTSKIYCPYNGYIA